MPINPALLIAAPMLQDSFVDKDGTPMAGGIVTCYQDNSRTTLKNWYYQSSNFADANGNYTFSPLPNPLTLSAAGTITDINGVDTIPFFYPFSEADQTQAQPYYITIVNHAGTNQITRPNFPYNRAATTPATTVVALNNLITNNGFWRNLQPNYINQSPLTSITLSTGGTSSVLSSTPYTASVWTGVSTLFGAIVCPSQHDGFSMPDIQFLKNNLSANDALTFTPFPLNTQLLIQNNSTPEYYINHVCSSAGTGETVKCYQFPISLHLNNLSNSPFTVSIQAQNGGGAAVIALQLLQFTGSGSASPAPTVIANTTLTLNSAWTLYTLTGIFPSSSGLSLSMTEDDAWYVQVQMPTNVICNVNFTKPSLYVTANVIPENDLLTYDQVDAIINSPRTGDVRISMNSFYFFGWVPMNNGTIGNASSGGTIRANSDTWQLFNLLWTLCKPFDTGSGGTFNPLCQIFSSGGAANDYGTTALADFTANKALALSRVFGNVIMGTVPASALPGFANQSTAVAYSVSTWTFTPTGIGAFFIGQAVNFTGVVLPTGIVTHAIYYVTNLTASTFQVATSVANAMAGTAIATANVSAGASVRVIIDQTASSVGQYAHQQLVGELAQHTHTGFGGSSFVVTGTTLGSPGGTGALTTAAVTGTTPPAATVPFNVTQPGTFYNIYMKL